MKHRSKCCRQISLVLFLSMCRLAGARASAGQDQSRLQLHGHAQSDLDHRAGRRVFTKRTGWTWSWFISAARPSASRRLWRRIFRSGNAAGSGVANAAVRGADMVSVGCTINVLAYELVVLDSIKSAGRLKRKVDRHQPLWQCLGRCCAGVAQRLGIAAAGRRQDSPSWRSVGASGRIQPRRDRRLSVAAGKCESDSRRTAAPRPRRYGRSQKALSPAVYLRRDDQELSRQESLGCQTSHDGADRSIAVFQDQ